jgi:hypothetical protein
MSLGDLAWAAATSPSVIAAYEAGRGQPSFASVMRILRAAGYELVPDLRPSVGGADATARGRELAAALDLAVQFPAHPDRYLDAPIFGRS